MTVVVAAAAAAVAIVAMASAAAGTVGGDSLHWLPLCVAGSEGA